MSLNQEHLNCLLREIKQLSPSTLAPLLLQAGMTDSDLDILATNTDIEDDFKTNWEEHLQIEDVMKEYAESTDPAHLLDIAVKLNQPLDCNHLNDALANSDLENSFVCLVLYKFEDLSAKSQKVAITEFIKIQKENGTKLNRYEARDELGAIHMNMYRYLYTGNLYDKDWFAPSERR